MVETNLDSNDDKETQIAGRKKDNNHIVFSGGDDGDQFFITCEYLTAEHMNPKCDACTKWGTYSVNISDCIEEWFEDINTAFEMVFKYIKIFHEKHDYVMQGDHYLESGQLTDVLFNSNILTFNRRHITPVLLKQAEKHGILLCSCKDYVDNVLKYDICKMSADYYRETKFILNAQLLKAFKSYDINFETITASSTTVNGVNSSKKEIQCYNMLKIKYADLEHQRKIPETRKTVDFYSPSRKMIIEFLGDYYHGNLDKFDSSTMNPTVQKTYGELHADTFKRFGILKRLGYCISYIWENDFNRLLKNTDTELDCILNEYI